MRSPEELVRVRLTGDGALACGAGSGRGAWLCAASPSCLDLAARRRAFDRALRAPVPAAAVELLRTELAERASMEGPQRPVRRPAV